MRSTTTDTKAGVLLVPRVAGLAILSVCLALIASCGPKSPPSTGVVPPAATPGETAAPAVPPVPPPTAATAPPAPAGGTPAPARRAARPPAPPPLLGHLSEADLRAYESWKTLFDTPYVPEPSSIETIRTHSGNLTVLMIVATWCPDSKRELPRWFAITRAAGLRETAVTMVGVDRAKKDSEGLTEKWGITRVPTFVFFRDGLEIGRVVERTPQGSTLEAEIAKILSGGEGA